MKNTSIVLLPGIHGTGELFEPFINCMPKRVTPIVISYPRDRQCGYSDLKKIVMDELPRDNDFFILGESFAGPLAIMIGGERPQRLKGIVLCATFISNPFRFISSWLILISIGPTSRLWPLLIRIRAMGAGAKIDGLAEMAIKAIRTVKLDVIAGRVKSILKVNVEKELRSCDVPILYIMGTKDHLIRKHNFEKIKKIRHDVLLKMINTQHFILQIKPVEASKVLVEFIDNVIKTGC